MSITVEVGLLSGKTATVQARWEEDVKTLRLRAQSSLGVGRGRLLDSSGHYLDEGLQIKHTNVQTGHILGLHLNQVQAQFTRWAFAAILGDGSVVS